MNYTELQESLSNDLAADIAISLHYDFYNDDCYIRAIRKYPTLEGRAVTFTHISQELIEDINYGDDIYYVIALDLYYKITEAALSKVGVIDIQEVRYAKKTI